MDVVGDGDGCWLDRFFLVKVVDEVFGIFRENGKHVVEVDFIGVDIDILESSGGLESEGDGAITGGG